MRERRYIPLQVDEGMSMWRRWNDTEKGKLKYSEKNTIQTRRQMQESVWSNWGMIQTAEN
jgi:hypothetical protein